MSQALSGGCLCGAVRYTVSQMPGIVGHCYCTDCRKSSGTGHCTHAGVPEAAVTITGKITFFERAADSGNMVARGFCPICGSAVYSTNSGMPGMIFLRASSLDDPGRVTPQVNVYTSRAASWDHADPALPSFAEMPPGSIPRAG